jgi:hypothetical protein
MMAVMHDTDQCMSELPTVESAGKHTRSSLRIMTNAELAELGYRLALFLHVIVAFAMGSVIFYLHICLERMRRATQNEELHRWTSYASISERWMPIITVTLLVPAIYMAVVQRLWAAPWMNISMLLVIAIAVSSPLLIDRKIKAIAKETEQKTGKLSAVVREKATSYNLYGYYLGCVCCDRLLDDGKTWGLYLCGDNRSRCCCHRWCLGADVPPLSTTRDRLI